jgi:hypothetical protein
MDPVLELDEPQPQVEPGAEARVRVSVRNVGELVEQYRLDVLGDAARWSEVLPRQVSALPGDDDQVVEVVFRPPPAPAAPVGAVPFGVRCVSLEHRDRCSVVEGDLQVSAVRDVEARLVPVSPRGRWAGRYRVLLANHGSVPMTLRMSATDQRQALGFAVAPREVTVPAGGSATVFVSARPRQPMMVGKTVTHNFTVDYAPEGYSRDGAATGAAGALPAGFEQRPVLNKTLLAVAVLVVGALVTGAILLLRQPGGAQLASGSSGPPPPIQLTGAVAAEPGSAQLVWQRSPYATAYTVQLIDKDNVLDTKAITDGEQTAYTWPNLPPGQHCFRVLAANAAGRSAASPQQCVTVNQPTTSALPGQPGGPSSAPPSQPGGSGQSGGPSAQPTSTAPPPGGGGGGGGVPQIPLPPIGQSGVNPAPGTDPIRPGFFVLYQTFPIDDPANGNAAQQFTAKLQAAKVQASLLDSRKTTRTSSGLAGLWLVYQDGFQTQDAALAECARPEVRTLAPACFATS